MVKNPPANAEDTGSIPDLEGFPMLQSNHAHVSQLLKPVSPTTKAVTAMRSLGTATGEWLAVAVLKSSTYTNS